MVPIWGKLGDLHGRKPILIWGIGLFLAGSYLSGLAGEFGDLPLLGGGMIQLIVFRAVQGLGGGALFTTAFAIIADLFPPRERGRFAGLFGSVFGLASAIGPLIGGYFTDHGTVTLFGHVVAGWRWVFYLNLPIGMVALFMVIAQMPKLSHARKGRVDYLGAALIVMACVPLLLALTFGGQKYLWSSPQVLGLFAIFLVATGLLIVVERQVQEPMLHLELFRNKVFTWANIAGFFSSMSFLSVVAFLPLLMQLGQGVKATSSGLATLPLMAGLILAAAVSGRIVSKTGRYKLLMLGGGGTVLVAILLLGTIDRTTTLPNLAWRMALLGLGLGPLQSLFGIAVQNAVGREQIGVATSANQFFRQIGSTVGIAVFGTFLTNEMNAKLGAWAMASGRPPLDLTQLRSLSAEAQTHAGALNLPDPIRDIIVSSVTHVVLLSAAIVVLALCATWMIPELPMASRAPKLPAGEPPPNAHL
jgi:EmrB/QacA subfamily drug resistance transporter